VKFLTNLRRHAVARPLLLILALLVVGLSYSVVSPQRSSAETEMTQQIEEGKALFDLTCSSCHGLGGEGTSQGPSLIGVEEEIARGGALFRANCSACHGIVGGGGAMPNGKYAPSLVETAPVHIYEAMRTGPQQMPTFSKDVMPDQSVREIVGFLEESHSQPNYGGLTMGDAGPVSEGFWAFVLGIGGLAIVATWIAKKGARAR